MGDFVTFFFASLLLFVHELGHFLTAGVLGCSLNKIYFYPFGGVSKFQMDCNIPIYKEFLILSMGPIFQMLFYLLLTVFPFTTLHLELLKQIHFGILFFNLLPIYPLDGGRLCFLLFSKFFSFYRSFQVVFFLSFLFILFFFYLFLVTKSLHFLFYFVLLLLLLWKENQKFPFYFEKFLLERFLGKYSFQKIKIIASIKAFQRNRKHLVYQAGRYLEEDAFLKQKFTKNS